MRQVFPVRCIQWLLGFGPAAAFTERSTTMQNQQFRGPTCFVVVLHDPGSFNQIGDLTGPNTGTKAQIYVQPPPTRRIGTRILTAQIFEISSLAIARLFRRSGEPELAFNSIGAIGGISDASVNLKSQLAVPFGELRMAWA
jgi:hypothetical protein